MKPLNQLMNNSLLAVKTALDGFQRYENADPAAARYFHQIIDYLIGPVDDLNVWAIREQLNQEDDRRMGYTKISTVSHDASVKLQSLTKQELAVLKLSAQGHRIDVMAQLLSLSISTIRNHRHNASHKLGLGSVKDLTKFAIDNFNFL